MSVRADAAASKKRYRVFRGEPGQNIVINLKDGEPIMEESPLTLASPSSSSLPAIIPEESKAVIISHFDETAHYRYNFITFFLKAEASQKDKLRSEIMDQFLSAYNSGHLLPNIHRKLGNVSRPTLYRLLGAFESGGIESLARKTGRKGTSIITEHEKNLLLALVLHQNHMKISFAIRLTKYILAQKGIPSPSCERTLRRYIDQFEKEHYDLWVLNREGEKALDDKALPYIERDRELIEVGEGLVADGHRLNFQVINPFTGKPCRATLFSSWIGDQIIPLAGRLCWRNRLNASLRLSEIVFSPWGKFPNGS